MNSFYYHSLTFYLILFNLSSTRPSDVKIVYSTNRFSGAEGITKYAKRIILHPQFRPTIYQQYFTTYSYDIALVEIDTITYT